MQQARVCGPLRRHQFSAWSACTKSCGLSGTQSRSRSIITRMRNGGYACPYLKEQRKCNQFACPRNCIFGDFGAWTTCTKSCGTGSQRRSRSVQQPQNGGSACPHTAETRSCNRHSCPKNCIIRDFGAWTTCTKSCGGGSQRRTRDNTQPVNGGTACPHSAETRPCNTHACPRNCVTRGWTAWTTCARRWLAAPLAQPDRASLRRQGLPALHRDAPVQPRPVPDPLHRPRFQRLDHVQHVRHRLAVALALDQDHARHGGYVCPYLGDAQLQLARVPEGLRGRPYLDRLDHVHQVVRHRLAAPLAHPHGAPLRRLGLPALHRDAPVQHARCPVDCVTRGWSAWTTCTKSCGDGSQRRSRSQTEPRFGGVACPHYTETRPCNTHACPQDCGVGSWTSVDHVH